MEITQRMVASTTVISLAGDLDGRSAAGSQEKIATLLPRNAAVLVDMTEVKYVSSAGLRTMLLIYRQAQCLGSTVALVGISPQLHEVLAATGFLGFFVVADTFADGERLLLRSIDGVA